MEPDFIPYKNISVFSILQIVGNQLQDWLRKVKHLFKSSLFSFLSCSQHLSRDSIEIAINSAMVHTRKTMMAKMFNESKYAGLSIVTIIISDGIVKIF